MVEPRVLMVGPGRRVMGGISTVINSYYAVGLHNKIVLKYISSMEDGSKIKKLLVAIKAYMEFCFNLKKYNVVHVHMAAQASFIRKSLFIKKAYKYKKKIIVHQHAADFDDFFLKQSNEAKRAEIRNIFSMADMVIVLSKEWADFFGKYVCDKEKIVVLYNGVILPAYTKKDYTDHNILFLGRLGERKGSYDLLEAASIVLEKVPDVKFFFGGDGEIKKSKEIAKSKGIADHVKFLGWVRGDERENYLKKCSIFTLPSYHEGMPMSVLEAMSYGMATVSTNAGGIPQIIENGINGIRIEAGNINALSSNLIELLKDENRKKDLGKHAVERIADMFDVSKNVDELCAFYVELLKEK